MAATVLPLWLRDERPLVASRPALADGASVRIASPGGQAGTDGAVMRLRVETRTSQALPAIRREWKALARRALEPNVFLEPSFALPAACHLSRAARPVFVLVWAEDAAESPRLIGLCPVQRGGGLFVGSLAAAWTHEQATTSAPLLDFERADEALDAILGWVGTQMPESAGLLMRGVPMDGPLAALLERRPRTAVLEKRDRAIMKSGGAVAEVPLAPQAAKHAKELRRQARRLSDLGPVAFRTVQGVSDVKVATELFLELEARGWKGAQRTALLLEPSLAAFTRAMTRMMAREGQCHIHSLDLDGRPVAMGIVLGSADRSYFWKIAYDEDFGRLSPGKILTRMLGDHQRLRPRVALTDSCAIPDHPMIDRMWPDRMVVGDILVARPGISRAFFDRSVRTARAHNALRRFAKRLKAKAEGAIARMRRRG